MKTTLELPNMNKSRIFFEAVYINDEVYVFGGIDDKKKQ